MPRVNERFQLYVDKASWKKCIEGKIRFARLSIQVITCNNIICQQAWLNQITWMLEHGAHKPKHFEFPKPNPDHKNQHWVAKRREAATHPEKVILSSMAGYHLVGSAHHLNDLVKQLRMAHLLKCPKPTF